MLRRDAGVRGHLQGAEALELKRSKSKCRVARFGTPVTSAGRVFPQQLNATGLYVGSKGLILKIPVGCLRVVLGKPKKTSHLVHL